MQPITNQSPVFSSFFNDLLLCSNLLQPALIVVMTYYHVHREIRRKVPEGSEYMSDHTSVVRGRVLGRGEHASESESECESESESASESASVSTSTFNNIVDE